MPSFRVTETLLGREVKRDTLERAKLIAYDMVVRMYQGGYVCELGQACRKVHSWTGDRQLRLRGPNNQFVNLERRN